MGLPQRSTASSLNGLMRAVTAGRALSWGRGVCSGGSHLCREGSLRRGTELSVPPLRPFHCTRTAKSFEKDAAWGMVRTGLSLPDPSPRGPASRSLQELCPPCHFCLPHGPSWVPVFSGPRARAGQLQPRTHRWGSSPACTADSLLLMWRRKARSTGQDPASPVDPPGHQQPLMAGPPVSGIGEASSTGLGSKQHA